LHSKTRAAIMRGYVKKTRYQKPQTTETNAMR
jgi:hypothetical protein